MGITATQEDLEDVDYHCDECKTCLTKEILRESFERTKAFYSEEKSQLIESLINSKESDFKCTLSSYSEEKAMEEEGDITRIKLRKLN